MLPSSQIQPDLSILLDLLIQPPADGMCLASGHHCGCCLSLWNLRAVLPLSILLLTLRLEEPQLWISDTCTSPGLSFLRYGTLIWIEIQGLACGGGLFVVSLYIQAEKSLMYHLESKYIFVLLWRQQVPAEEQGPGSQPSLDLNSGKPTWQCVVLDKLLKLSDKNGDNDRYLTEPLGKLSVILSIKFLTLSGS